MIHASPAEVFQNPRFYRHQSPKARLLTMKPSIWTLACTAGGQRKQDTDEHGTTRIGRAGCATTRAPPANCASRQSSRDPCSSVFFRVLLILGGLRGLRGSLSFADHHPKTLWKIAAAFLSWSSGFTTARISSMVRTCVISGSSFRICRKSLSSSHTRIEQRCTQI